jgi:CRP-like cAMP-binding protein
VVQQPSDLVAGLTEAEATTVLALGRPMTLAPGSTLFRLGDPANCAYLIERGCIALSLPMQLGGRPQDVIVQEHHAGDTLGWSALIPPHRFTMSATAPLATALLAFDRAALMAFCAANPNVGYRLTLNIAAVVGRRLQVLQAMWLREMQRAVNGAHA